MRLTKEIDYSVSWPGNKNSCSFDLINCRVGYGTQNTVALKYIYSTCATALELPVKEGSGVPLFEFAVAEVVLWRAT